MATANGLVCFQGCVQEVINNQELQLTELGAKGGSNVGDCDVRACGYTVCRNRGECIVNGTFLCRCPPHWTGNTCDPSVYCLSHLCLHQSLCIPDWPFSYSCVLWVGWEGFVKAKLHFQLQNLWVILTLNTLIHTIEKETSSSLLYSWKSRLNCVDRKSSKWRKWFSGNWSP